MSKLPNTQKDYRSQSANQPSSEQWLDSPQKQRASGVETLVLRAGNTGALDRECSSESDLLLTKLGENCIIFLDLSMELVGQVLEL